MFSLLNECIRFPDTPAASAAKLSEHERIGIMFGVAQNYLSDLCYKLNLERTITREIKVLGFYKHAV